MLAPEDAALETREAALVRLVSLEAPEASCTQASLTDFLRTEEDILRTREGICKDDGFWWDDRRAD